MEKHELQSVLDNLRRERKQLIEQYHGVRPSRVSTDLGLLSERIEQLKEEILGLD